MDIQNFSLDRISRISWDRMCNAAPESTPFSFYRWLTILDYSYPEYKVKALIAAEGDCYLSAIPYVSFRKLCFSQILSLPWGTPVLGSYSDDDETGLELLRSWVKIWPGALGRQAISFCTELPSAGEARRILRACRFRRQRYLKVPLAGRSFDGWESELSSSTRNQNRQAQKRGAVFHEIEQADDDIIERILKLRKKTAFRHGSVPARFSDMFLEKLIEESNGLAKVWGVSVDGNLAAYSVVLHSQCTNYLWDYATDEKYNEYRPNNLMYSELIRMAIKEKREWFDMGVVPDEADGLLRFKESMGGLQFFRTEASRTSFAFDLANRLRKKSS